MREFLARNTDLLFWLSFIPWGLLSYSAGMSEKVENCLIVFQFICLVLYISSIVIKIKEIKRIMKQKKYTQKERIDQLEVVFAKLFLSLQNQGNEIRKIQKELNIENKEDNGEKEDSKKSE